MNFCLAPCNFLWPRFRFWWGSENLMYGKLCFDKCQICCGLMLFCELMMTWKRICNHRDLVFTAEGFLFAVLLQRK
jgi:hypothetical protein